MNRQKNGTWVLSPAEVLQLAQLLIDGAEVENVELEDQLTEIYEANEAAKEEENGPEDSD